MKQCVCMRDRNFSCFMAYPDFSPPPFSPFVFLCVFHRYRTPNKNSHPYHQSYITSQGRINNSIRLCMIHMSAVRCVKNSFYGHINHLIGLYIMHTTAVNGVIFQPMKRTDFARI